MGRPTEWGGKAIGEARRLGEGRCGDGGGMLVMNMQDDIEVLCGRTWGQDVGVGRRTVA